MKLEENDALMKLIKSDPAVAKKLATRDVELIKKTHFYPTPADVDLTNYNSVLDCVYAGPPKALVFSKEQADIIQNYTRK